MFGDRGVYQWWYPCCRSVHHERELSETITVMMKKKKCERVKKSSGEKYTGGQLRRGCYKKLQRIMSNVLHMQRYVKYQADPLLFGHVRVQIPGSQKTAESGKWLGQRRISIKSTRSVLHRCKLPHAHLKQHPRIYGDMVVDQQSKQAGHKSGKIFGAPCLYHQAKKRRGKRGRGNPTSSTHLLLPFII